MHGKSEETGGPKKSSSLKNAGIIRRDPDGNRLEEKIDLRRVGRGEDPGIMLRENDILFVPGSVAKEAVLRAIEATIQVGTGVLIGR